MSRITILILALATLCSGLLAQDNRPYKPWFIHVLLDDSDAICVAKLAKVTVLPTREKLLRFKVSESLKGSASGQVLVGGSNATMSSNRDLDKILFLKSSPRGAMWTLRDAVDLPTESAGTQVDFIKRYLKTITRGPQSLERRVKWLSMSHLQSTNSWIRRIVLRELNVLAQRFPRLFDGGDLLAIDRLVVTDLDRRERQIKKETLIAIEEGQAVAWTRSRLVFPGDASRRSFLADLAIFDRSTDHKVRVKFLDEAAEIIGRKAAPFYVHLLEDRMTEVAVRAAYLLGEMESGAGVTRLLKLVAESKQNQLKTAAVEALGKIGTLKSVPVLVKSLEDKLLLKPAIMALARINTAASALALGDLQQRLETDPDSSPKLRRFLNNVKSAAFRKKLVVEKEQRRKKYKR